MSSKHDGLKLGLDIKGPHDINEPVKWKRKLRNDISVNSRAGISRSKRKVKITLPKLKFMEDDDCK